MRASTGLWFLLVVVAVAVSPVAAQPPADNDTPEIQVLINEPSSLEFVFGRVDVEAEVYSDREIIAVELFVDGRPAGKRAAPPYRFQVNVGEENLEHRFEVVATDATGATGRSRITTPAIEINEEYAVELQQLYVTVERAGDRVLDLGKADFRIFDDGKEEALVTFARGDVPLAAALLVDSSASMAGERLQAGLEGVEAFASGMKELDEVTLMLFSDQLLHSTPFTNDAGALLDPLAGGFEASGNTAINDHLYLALMRLDERQGRRVVVLFTDGADLHSVLSMEDVLWKARRSQALVYWLRYDDGSAHKGFATAWRDGDSNEQELLWLEETVEQSGGRILEIDTVGEIAPAFAEIMSELREQYVLGYYPTTNKNDGGWHEVAVRVKRSGLKVRTRGGYVDF